MAYSIVRFGLAKSSEKVMCSFEQLFPSYVIQFKFARTLSLKNIEKITDIHPSDLSDNMQRHENPKSLPIPGALPSGGFPLSYSEQKKAEPRRALPFPLSLCISSQGVAAAEISTSRVIPGGTSFPRPANPKI
jgi:hypothetical protein